MIIKLITTFIIFAGMVLGGFIEYGVTNQVAVTADDVIVNMENDLDIKLNTDYMKVVGHGYNSNIFFYNQSINLAVDIIELRRISDTIEGRDGWKKCLGSNYCFESERDGKLITAEIYFFNEQLTYESKRL